MKKISPVLLLLLLIFSFALPVVAQSRSRQPQQTSRFRNWNFFFRGYRFSSGGAGGETLVNNFGQSCEDNTQTLPYIDQPGTIETDAIYGDATPLSLQDYLSTTDFLLTKHLGVICLPSDYDPSLLTLISPANENLTPSVYDEYILQDGANTTNSTGTGNDGVAIDNAAVRTGRAIAVLPTIVFDEPGNWTLQYGTDTPLQLVINIPESGVSAGIIGEVIGSQNFYFRNFPASATITAIGITDSEEKFTPEQNIYIVATFTFDTDESGTAYISLPEQDYPDEATNQDLLIGDDLINYLFLDNNNALIQMLEPDHWSERDTVYSSGLEVVSTQDYANVAIQMLSELGFDEEINDPSGVGQEFCTYTFTRGEWVYMVMRRFDITFSEFRSLNPGYPNYDLVLPEQEYVAPCLE